MTVSEHNPAHQLNRVLKVVLHSNVNIDPQALFFLGSLNAEDSEIENFLQHIAFLPHFSSYVSYEMLKEEWKTFKKGKNQARVQDSHQTNQPLNPAKDKVEKSEVEKSQVEKSELEEIIDPEFDFDSEEVNEILGETFSQISPESQKLVKNPTKQSILAPNPKIPTDENPILHKPDSQDKDDSNYISENDPESLLDEDTNPNSSQSINKSKNQDATINNLKSSESMDNESLSRLEKIRNQKRKSWESLDTSSSNKIKSGTSTFKPLAAEYEADVKILKDPTGKLYTEGKLAEFLMVQRDKFEKLSKILQKRPEASGLLPINMINRLESSTEVKFIGMVNEKRLTSSKNYLINFEDTTGDCIALVQEKKSVVHKLVDYLLPDHVVIVDGFLSVNDKTNSRIILVNDIIFPDSPNTHSVQTPEEDIAMCLISDTHFGSVEWMEKIWYRFVDYLNCRVGNDRQRAQAGKIKYLCIAGDIVDGIGVYPNQEKHLKIKDIYQQYEACASYLAELPDYLEILLIPGDHDAVRKAVPAPALSKEFSKPLYDQGFKLLGNPSMVSLHGVKTQLYHGTSLIDLNMAIPGMSNEDPFGTMKEFIRARDLVPTYGKKTELAPVEENWFVLDELPDVLHTGHLHKNGFGKYHGILLVNSGCFQDQTEFMDSLGIIPDYGKPTVINMKGNLTPKVIDLVGDM